MRDKIVEVIEDILGEKYFKEDCKVDSLIRIDDEIYDCEGCVLLDTINTVRIMCPLIMKRETRMLK